MARSHISRMGQIKIYVGKCFRLFVTERQWKNFISTFIIVMLIALVTGEDMFQTMEATKKGAFAIVCAGIWVGLFNSIQSICKERDIIKREHRSGVHISSYLLAHVIYEFVLSAAEALIILGVTLIRNISHLPEEAGVFTFFGLDLYLVLFIVIFASDMMALLVSSGVKTEQMAMTIMPFILIIQLLMSGMVFELKGIPDVISNFTISRWGLDAICVVSNVENMSWFADESLKSTPGNLAQLLGKLIFFALLYIVIAILLLERVDSDER